MSSIWDLVVAAPVLAAEKSDAVHPLWEYSWWLVLWAAIALMVIIPAGFRCYARLRRAQIDAELKHEMIARGMSAEEIERVLAAGSSDSVPPT